MHVKPNSRKERWAEFEVWLDSTRTKLKGNGSFSLFMTRVCGRWVAAAAMTHMIAVTAVTVTDSWFLIHDDLMTHDS